MNVLLLLAHSVAEFDDLRMLTDLGFDVFSVGAYSEPGKPGDAMRPALPDAPDHPELRQLVIEQRERHAGESESWAIDWAKADLHPALIDWADVVICHNYLDRWIVPQWGRLRDRTQVIWRTCGQSDPMLEGLMKPFHEQGLQIVRYSPKEREFFERRGTFAGEDELIRFGKYPGDYPKWIGDGGYVANVTQDMAGRGDFCGLSFWLETTKDLPAKPAGPGSEKLPGGIGARSYPDMLDYLQHAGAYLYTGTSPASYTLGLIEAMFVGAPIVCMGADRFMVPGLFEAPEIIGRSFAMWHHSAARHQLGFWLEHPDRPRSAWLRTQAAELFSIDVVGPQWQEFLS